MSDRKEMPEGLPTLIAWAVLFAGGSFFIAVYVALWRFILGG
jgi:hypothetical protein